MRTPVVYDGAADHDASPDTTGVLDAVHAVVRSLTALGHAAYPVAVTRPLDRIVARLSRVDLVFNLCEGLDGDAAGEVRVAGLLELAGPPVTGAASETLALCRRKDRVNAVLRAAGLAVPDWIGCGADAVPDWHRFPAIVKPSGEDGSVGIGDDSVVTDAVELAGALGRLGRRPALVQAFLDGREFNVGFVGSDPLPVSEIVFGGATRVVSYAAKWHAGSRADVETRPVCPARITTDLHGALVDLAAGAWAAVGGSGYGRVDLRTDRDGTPYVLEVNPNPDLAPDAGLARMAGVAGMGFDGLVARIVREALS